MCTVTGAASQSSTRCLLLVSGRGADGLKRVGLVCCLDVVHSELTAYMFLVGVLLVNCC